MIKISEIIFLLIGISWAKIIDVPGLGKLEGLFEENVNIFKGIEYGRIEQDFQPAVPYGAFSDSVYQTNEIPENPTSNNDFNSSLCLTLGIYVKNISAKQPVMVWIPGHDLSDKTFGTPSKYLLDKSIVIVSINYRTGGYGFLSTLSDEFPGNLGILDIILALKWIKQYIEYFGGDPNRVTLLGQFKAAGIIHILTMSPLSEGLFQQVIYQTGSAYLTNLTTTNPLETARKVAETLDCNVETQDEINECFSNSSSADLVQAYNDLLKSSKFNQFSLIVVGGPSGVLPEEPAELIKKGKARSYPTIGGFVDNPAIVLLDHYYNSERDYSFFSPKGLMDEFGVLFNENIQKYREELSKFGDIRNDTTFYKLFPINLAYQTLHNFLVPGLFDLVNYSIKSGVIKTLSENKKNSYLYILKYKVKDRLHTYEKKTGNRYVDATLFDESMYLFEVNHEDYRNRKRIRESLIDSWSSFAETGVPRISGVFEWPNFVNGTNYLKIDRPISFGINVTDELYLNTIRAQTNIVKY